jgi:DNA-binding SARP family transcriptional activator
VTSRYRFHRILKQRRIGQRLRCILEGIGSFVALVVLMVGVPIVLAFAVGWPLPQSVPNGMGLEIAFAHWGVLERTSVNMLACVAWVAWSCGVVSVAAELFARARGRTVVRIPVASVFQPVASRLVASLLVGILGFGRVLPTAAGADLPPSAHGAMATSESHPTALVPPRTSSDAPVQTPPAVSPEPTATVTYVVQRGDTLWGIAQEQLGDPLRWSEIFALNQGRPEPGGVTLTDSHWIDPGWTLLLPATEVATAPPPAVSATGPKAPPDPSPVYKPAPSPVTTTTTATSATPQAKRQPAHPDHRVTAERRGAVVLPTGSVVGGSFAAGVAFAVAIGRLRRRRGYRYRPPGPADTRTTANEHPTLSRLRAARAPSEDANESEIPVAPFTELERRERPDQIEIGTRGDEPVTVELTDLSGVALVGPTSDDVVRAIVAALLVRAEPGAAAVLLPEALALDLLPGLEASMAVRRTGTVGQTASALESERVTRARWLDAADVEHVETFRTQNPEHPFPSLLALVGDPSDHETLGRLRALARDSPRFGMTIIFVGAGSDYGPVLVLDKSRRVVKADGFLELEGTELFGLLPDEGVAVLAAVNEAAESGQSLHEDSAVDDASEPEERPSDQETDDVWKDSDEIGDRPIHVRMFGHLEVEVGGEVVASGLRARARDLLAWHMLHPSGSTSDEAVEALWPDTDPERVHGQFWRSFSDLRSGLRTRSDIDLEVLTKVGEHYRPAAAEFDCDLWTFQASLAVAAELRDSETTRRALRCVVDVYRGDLLAGDDRPWVEPVRQNFHRRALDAHLRLAELEEEAGRCDAAVELLERAIERDRYAEEPYRRLMALHGRRDRLDAVRDVWLMLQGRLAELDLDVDDATASLYQQLVRHSPSKRDLHRAGS